MFKKFFYFLIPLLLFTACSATLSPAQQRLNNKNSISFAKSTTKKYLEVTKCKNKATLEAIFYLSIMESSEVIEFSTAAQRAFCELDFSTMSANFPPKRLEKFESNCAKIRATKWYTQAKVINRANFVKVLATNYIRTLSDSTKQGEKSQEK